MKDGRANLVNCLMTTKIGMQVDKLEDTVSVNITIRIE